MIIFSEANITIADTHDNGVWTVLRAGTLPGTYTKLSSLLDAVSAYDAPIEPLSIERSDVFLEKCAKHELGEDIREFVSRHSIRIDEQGDLQLYKGCKAGGLSYWRNDSTIVTKGRTHDGRIVYTAHEEVRVDPTSVPGINEEMGCCAGLYAGTLDLARSFGPVRYTCSVAVEDILSVMSEKVRALGLQILAAYTDGAPDSLIPIDAYEWLIEQEDSFDIMSDPTGTSSGTCARIAGALAMSYQLHADTNKDTIMCRKTTQK